MRLERDSGTITHFLSYISQPRGNMISALLGSRPWASLVEYHVHNAWIRGAHHWWWGNGFTESNLILVVQDLQECRIALVLVTAYIVRRGKSDVAELHVTIFSQNLVYSVYSRMISA